MSAIIFNTHAFLSKKIFSKAFGPCITSIATHNVLHIVSIDTHNLLHIGEITHSLSV
jgi:hypothetical protein